MPEHANEHRDATPVVIIGGGLAGLVAAAHLAARGVPPVLLDADRLWLGGRLAAGDDDSFIYEGREWRFRPEHGVHALWGGYANLRATLERFTSTQLITSPGEEWLNRWGRDVRHIESGNPIRRSWLPAPFHYLNLLFHPRIWANIAPWDFLSLPGVLVSILLTLAVDPIAEGRAWDGLMLKEYFRGWTPNLRATFTGLAVNLLAAPRETISLASFIAALRFYTMLRRDSWAMQFFPEDAHTSLLMPLQRFITAHDGLIMQGATATELQRQGALWRIVVEDSRAGGYRSLFAEQVIIATNAPGAQRLLTQSAATRPAAEAMRWPQAVRSGVVRLWFSVAPRGGAPSGMMTGDFAPDNFFWLHRLYSDCAAWHSATGGSAIELHVYEHHLLEQSDANLLVLVVTEVQRAFPELKGHFVHGVVRRNSQNHTLWRVPSADSLHVQTPWPQLWAAGDWVGYPHPALWMERASATGIAAANGVLEALGLAPYPVLQPPPPEALAQGLQALLRGGRRLLAPALRLLRRRSRS